MSDPVVLLSTGDVVGPAGGVTDNSMVLFSGTSGKLIKGNNAQVTSAGLALLDDIDANAQLTTLGLTTTQPQFDNSVKQATTEFVQRALGNLSGDPVLITAHTVLTASQAGNLFIVSAAWQANLPALAATPNGAAFHFLFVGAGALIKGNGSEAIQGITSANLYSPVQGEKVTVVKRNNAWYLGGGGVGAECFGAFLSASGYQKLPIGLIIQWGTFASAANSTTTITFPIAFPNACRSVVATVNDDVGTVTSYPFSAARILNPSSFSLRSYYNQSGILNSWFAVGY